MWDMEVVGGAPADCFNPEFSFLSVASHPNDTCDYSGGTGNVVGVDPLVNTDLVLNGLQLESGLNLLGGDAIIVRISRGEDGPQGTLGPFFVDLVDMHLLPTSPAIDAGVDPTADGLAVPVDFDDDIRPINAVWDIGADEVAAGTLRALYISLNCGPSGGAATCDDDLDIMRVDGTTLSIVFDGSQVMTATGTILTKDPVNAMIDGFAFLSPTEILISFQRPVHRTVLGIGPAPGQPAVIDDSDVVLFTATSLGAVTTGTWSWYFDGSDVELTLGVEDVDAVGVTPTGGLLLSTVATASVQGQTFADEDVFQFEFTGPPGHVTAGTYSPYFDGSAVDGANGTGLTANSEDIDGFSTDPITADVHLSTLGNIRVAENVDELFGQDDDVVTCVAELGATITCDDWELLFDGKPAGLAPYDVKGLEVYSTVLP
jgi:hypothetical protein